MKTFTFSTAAALLSFAASADAHGFVSSMVIGGKTYTGPSPYSPVKGASPIRKITTINPITDVNSRDMTCGTGAKAGLATIVAPATAGSSITFTWKSGTGNWGHSIGPIETYIAKCDGDCVKFDATKATFYKIAETGRKPNSMEWYQADIKKGKSYTMTLPKNLLSGDYLIRHELVALHFATSKNGAQFYPSCSQVRITGGSKVASLKAATSASGGTFPGAYKSTDKGIFTPNIFTSKSYVFPGPGLASFSSVGASGNLLATNASSVHSSASPSPTAEATPTTHIAVALPTSVASTPSPSTVCKNKSNKRSTEPVKVKRSVKDVRHSRVMRRSH